MSRNYNIFFSKTCTASATVPMGNLCQVGATMRPKITGLIAGSGGATPGDNSCLLGFQRSTVRGTASTSVVPVATEPADPPAISIFDNSWSGNPTLTASAFVLYLPFNMRATVRWFAAMPGKELIIPATAAAGLALMAVSNGNAAFAADFSIEFEE